MLLTVGCSLLILGLLEGGTAWTLGLTDERPRPGGRGSRLSAFLRVERSAAEPVLPLWVFQRRVLVSGNLVVAAAWARC